MTTEHAAGPEPSRSTGTVTLTWGYVTLPMTVWAGSSDGIAVERHEYVDGDHPVGRCSVDKTTDVRLADTAVVVKKAAASDGTLVELDDDEIEQAAVSGFHGGASEVLAFVPLDTIGPVYQPVAINQLRPAKLVVGKKKVDNPAADKAFALLLSVMGERQVAALFKVKLRGPARYAALTPDGRMVTLAFAEQVRPTLAIPQVEFTDAEMRMAREMVDDVIGVATPVLVDTVSAEVQAFVDAKAAGVTVDTDEQVPLAPVVDLFAALEASVAAAKAAREPATLAPVVGADTIEAAVGVPASLWPQETDAA